MTVPANATRAVMRTAINQRDQSIMERDQAIAELEAKLERLETLYQSSLTKAARFEELKPMVDEWFISLVKRELKRFINFLKPEPVLPVVRH